MSQFTTIGKKRSRSPVKFDAWGQYRLTDLFDWFQMPEHEREIMRSACSVSRTNRHRIGAETLIQGAEFLMLHRALANVFEKQRQLQALELWSKGQVSE
jgi:hypothetical protein